MERSVTALGWGSRLSEVWDVGVLVLGSDRRIEFANPRARALLGVDSDLELEQAWALIHGELAALFEQAVPGRSTPVEGFASAAPSPGKETLRIQLYVIEEEGCVGYLLLLQSADRAAAVDASMRHAARNRSLGPLYRDLAHDLKGALNVIAMNVELLSRAADTSTPKPDLAAKSANVVRRELSRLDRTLAIVLEGNLIERQAPKTFDLSALCHSPWLSW